MNFFHFPFDEFHEDILIEDGATFKTAGARPELSAKRFPSARRKFLETRSDLRILPRI